uniref:GATA transcription factor 15-like isoform X2 n=1 Tax=Nicotiana sylvestris TaxID=4096 RepID=A0A1U7W187_NICSY|nr:PREDICTED: GATA transcription factor 15-like isoform X2 [Nicotiana sylvestris]
MMLRLVLIVVQLKLLFGEVDLLVPRKKIRALLGLNKEDKKSKAFGNKSIGLQHQSCNSSSNSSSGDSSRSSSFGKKTISSSLKSKVFPFGREVILQKPRSSSTQKRKLGDVEQAAFLLMALSCGSFCNKYNNYASIRNKFVDHMKT